MSPTEAPPRHFPESPGVQGRTEQIPQPAPRTAPPESGGYDEPLRGAHAQPAGAEQNYRSGPAYAPAPGYGRAPAQPQGPAHPQTQAAPEYAQAEYAQAEYAAVPNSETGDGGADAPPSGGTGRSWKRVWLPVIAAVVVLAALIAGSAYVWPGWAPKTFSQSGLQQGVEQVLQSGETGRQISDVRCPSGIKVREGEQFECRLKVNGEEKKVTLTVTDKNGTYSVSEPVDP